MSTASVKKKLQIMANETNTDELFMSFAKSLAESPAMASSWEYLERKQINFYSIVRWVDEAYSEAVNEESSLPANEEAVRYENLAQRIIELRNAIQDLPSLSTFTTRISIGGQQLDDESEMIKMQKCEPYFAFTSTPYTIISREGAAIPTICLDDLLEFASNELKNRPCGRVFRTVKRRKKDSVGTSFVRILSFRFADQYGERFPSVVASAHSVVFPKLKPIGEKSVTAMLKNTMLPSPPKRTL